MAFNAQTLRTRTVTAAVFVVIMLAGLLWNQWSFLILFSIIHFGCWWEYFRLVEKIHKTFFHPYVKLGLMIIGYGLMLWFCGHGYEIKGYGFKANLSLPVSAAGFALLLIGIFQKPPVTLKSFGAAMPGLLYISLSWGLMMDLYQQSVDIHFHDTMFVFGKGILPIIIIASIWINDTMAYLVGSLIGKTPLSGISPKKTWEGTIGGITLSIVVVGFLFPLIYLKSFSYYLFMSIIPITVISAMAGTFGDLLQSKLKRMAGVKDSGTLMPGHGGFLDRFDSMLLAVPAVWLYVFLFVR